jgi:hypothetical protein
MTGQASYPPAPWRLIGTSVQAFRLIPTEVARAMVPAGLEVVSVLPGKTLGALYCASYHARLQRSSITSSPLHRLSRVLDFESGS